MTDDHASTPVDPPVGSPEYWALDAATRLRICEERVGMRGDAFMTPGPPYTDPISNPIDDWS
jgi:hypothetical protein